jgi:ribosomal protein S27AE
MSVSAAITSNPVAIREPVVAECQHCHSRNLKRNGWYRSKTFDEGGERRQIVQCGECGRYTYLPAGVGLPSKPPSTEALRKSIASRTALYEQMKDVREVRPECPRCGGTRVLHHGKSKWTGRHRWECRDCGRNFIKDTPAFIDHRRKWLLPMTNQALLAIGDNQEPHFDQYADDPKEEAEELYQWCTAYGTMSPTKLFTVRMEIIVSRQDRECLDLLVANGILQRADVQYAIKFRIEVLRYFDALCDGEPIDQVSKAALPGRSSIGGAVRHVRFPPPS